MPIYAQIACDLPRDPKMLMVGWQARAVYVEAVLFARENLTDGEIIRVALPLWMHDMNTKTRTKYLEQLANVGALERTDDGWRFPDRVWKKWNPTRSEVEEKREAERQRKAEYRRQRQAVRDVSQDCPNGTSAGVPRVSQARPRQPEPEPEPKPKEKPEPEPEPETFTSVRQNITSEVPDPTLRGFSKP